VSQPCPLLTSFYTLKWVEGKNTSTYLAGEVVAQTTKGAMTPSHAGYPKVKVTGGCHGAFGGFDSHYPGWGQMHASCYAGIRQFLRQWCAGVPVMSKLRHIVG